MANPQNLKPFDKNDPITGKKDPRINRRGRAIKGKDAFRREWEKIWAEVMFDSNGHPIIDEATGEKMTRLRARMKTMTTSRNPKELEIALHYTFGKPKEEVEVNTNSIIEIGIKQIDYRTGITQTEE